MRDVFRTGAGALLLVLIMALGSLGLWIGTPLLWLWVGSQFQGATSSLGGALALMFVGAVVSIVLLAMLLGKLSAAYRSNCEARGLPDPGNYMLEAVLVVSAGFTLVVFGIWFFFLAGASPIPLGLNV
jgi:hypothetical protein